ncbi:MAG: hypothetical protein SGILL_002474 [Bacillariaceae sp.]
MYTPLGEPIRNLEAYRAAGGQPCNERGEAIANPTAYRNAIEASIRQNTDDPKYHYHYTDDKAAKSIRQSGTITASSKGHFGSGTYLTSKPPRCNDDVILSNNYGRPSKNNSDQVQSYVRIDADRVNAHRVTNADGRNVWKVDGDVHLNDHNGFVAGRQSSSISRNRYCTTNRWDHEEEEYYFSDDSDDDKGVYYEEKHRPYHRY